MTSGTVVLAGLDLPHQVPTGDAIGVFIAGGVSSRMRGYSGYGTPWRGKIKLKIDDHIPANELPQRYLPADE
jgi:hypothetical protein